MEMYSGLPLPCASLRKTQVLSPLINMFFIFLCARDDHSAFCAHRSANTSKIFSLGMLLELNKKLENSDMIKCI